MVAPVPCQHGVAVHPKLPRPRGHNLSPIGPASPAMASASAPQRPEPDGNEEWPYTLDPDPVGKLQGAGRLRGD
jgi:hypothetical protein